MCGKKRGRKNDGYAWQSAKVPHSETRNTNIENYVSEIYGIIRCGARHWVLVGGYFHAQLHHGWSRQVPAVTHE